MIDEGEFPEPVDTGRGRMAWDRGQVRNAIERMRRKSAA